MALTDKLTAIADAIRGKTGTTDLLTLDGMVTAIEGISGDGGRWPEAPDDGKTRLYITLHEGRTSPMLGVCPNGTVTVDWGDGTEPDVLTGTSTATVVWTPNHAYAAPGDYVITLTVDGEMRLSGSNNLAYILANTSSSTDTVNHTYRSALRRVVIGSGVKNILTGFAGCRSLLSAVLPRGVTTIGATFYNCSSLTSVTLPDGITTLGGAVSGEVFSNCTALTSVAIPGSVTEIKSSTFYGCYGVAWYDFTKHTAVPVLSDSGAFTGIAADCEIRVPATLYDEWIAATNWATYASYIKAY